MSYLTSLPEGATLFELARRFPVSIQAHSALRPEADPDALAHDLGRCGGCVRSRVG